LPRATARLATSSSLRQLHAVCSVHIIIRQAQTADPKTISSTCDSVCV
jgi:hypothetical protein